MCVHQKTSMRTRSICDENKFIVLKLKMKEYNKVNDDELENIFEKKQ
jgi:hypothetical protein